MDRTTMYHSNQFKVPLTVETFIWFLEMHHRMGFSLTDGGMIYGAASELLKNEKCMSVESNDA